VLLSQTLQEVEAPKAATVSRSVLGGIIGSPNSPPRYKVRAGHVMAASLLRGSAQNCGA
jgi:hypothetical protein